MNNELSGESLRLHRIHCVGCGECNHGVMHITERGHRQLHDIERKRRHDPSDHDCRGGVRGDRFELERMADDGGPPA